MVEENIPLVEHIVNRVIARLPASHERDDLVQTGILGLIAAVQRFDPDHGNAFSTYAGRRIEGSIIDHLRRTDWAPRSVRSLERRVRQAEEMSVNQMTRRSRETNLSHDVGVSSSELAKLRRDVAKARIDSLDRPVGDEDGATLGLSVSDGSMLVDDTIEEKELLGYLRSAIRLLPERHAIVIRGYFFEEKSMTQLGEYLGVTQSRASQLKDEALRMMRGGIDHSYGGEPADPSPTQRQRDFNASLAAPRPWDERVVSGPEFS